jgi:hypothetical protein
MGGEYIIILDGVAQQPTCESLAEAHSRGTVLSG